MANENIAMFVVVVAIGVGLVVFAAKSENGSGYRRGQIDALNGNVHYVLTTQPSGETIWVEKK